MLKMLAGLLQPTTGVVTVAGYSPAERDFDYLRRISMVQGNRSQMMWDIPAADFFAVLGEIYAIPRADFRQRLDELIDLLELGDLLTKPVRNLSLGERMKCELWPGCCIAHACSSSMNRRWDST
jgi:ABC-2 type transport system ATP-binding protein